MNIKPLHILSGDLWGGGEAQMGLQIGALRNLGVSAEALLFNFGETERQYSSRGIPVTVLEESRGFFSLVSALKRHITAGEFTVIITHGYKELFAAVASTCGVPIIHVTHGFAEVHTGFRQLKMTTYRFLEAVLCRTVVRRRVVVTEEMKRFFGCSAVTVIRNVAAPVSESSETELTSSIDKRGRDNEVQVIAVGRLFQVKRFDRAIRIIHQCNKLLAGKFVLRLSIVGEGPLEGELRSLSEELGEPVTFLGFRKDAARLISASDLMLITSDSEGLPTVLLEAMFAGTPVCSVDLPGIREAISLIPGYPHRFFPLSDDGVAAAVEAVELPRASAELRNKVSALYSAERAAKEHLHLYREVCDTLRHD